MLRKNNGNIEFVGKIVAASQLQYVEGTVQIVQDGKITAIPEIYCQPEALTDVKAITAEKERQKKKVPMEVISPAVDEMEIQMALAILDFDERLKKLEGGK